MSPKDPGVRPAPPQLRWRKKPVVVEAVQWNGTNLDALVMWGAPATPLPASNRPDRGEGLIIGTLEDGPNCEAVHVADVGDWIIRGVKGEFYPCKPDIFAATYDPPVEGTGARPAPAIDAEKELALIQGAARDASLSDGAVRAIAAGTVEPTPDDIAWAQSELRRADPAQEREP